MAVNPGIGSAPRATWGVIGAGAGGGTIKRAVDRGARSGPGEAAAAMPGRAEPSGERTAAGPVAVPVPVAPGATVRPGGAGLRAKGFAITDLLGLEAELQPPPGPPAAAAGGYEGGGALGLGLLCGLGGPGAPCLLPSPLPLLPARGPRPPPGPLPAARRHKENISGERGRGRGGRSPVHGDPRPEPLQGLPRTCGPRHTAAAASILPPARDRSRAPCPSGLPSLRHLGKGGLRPPAPGWRYWCGAPGSAAVLMPPVAARGDPFPGPAPRGQLEPWFWELGLVFRLPTGA